MLKYSAAVAAVCTVLASGAALAQTPANGFYSSTGTVASATSQCAVVGLTAGAANNSQFFYPGAGKTGFAIYVPSGGGILQLCNGFPAIPSTGLNGFSANATCTIYTIGGNLPAETVNFAFTSIQTDKNSSVGTTTITIPTADPIGGGCVATVDTTAVGTGK